MTQRPNELKLNDAKIKKPDFINESSRAANSCAPSKVIVSKKKKIENP